jgi:hypothetical protein
MRMSELQKQRIASLVTEFDQQGAHRTGSRVDQISGDWVCAQIRKAGSQPEKMPFSLPLVHVDSCKVGLADLLVDGVPLFDCLFPDLNFISGTIGELGSDAEIGVIMAPPQVESPQVEQLHQARLANLHRAIVVVTHSRFPGDGIALQNAEHYPEPFGPPVVQIANSHWSAIEQAMRKREVASIWLQASRTTGEAFNIQAVIEGSDSSLAPVIIMTPRSSWWNSTSERAGGLICFLEMIRKAHACKGERSLVFLANTGHELHHAGLAAFLRGRPGIEKSAYLWVHLGANFAAASPAGARLQFSDDVLKQGFIDLLKSFKPPVYEIKPHAVRAVGEARNIHDAGGRYLSILAGNDLFHHPADRWPAAVNLDNLCE